MTHMKLPGIYRKIGISLFLSVFITLFLYAPSFPSYAGNTLTDLSDVLSSNTVSATNVVHTISFTITMGVGTSIAISIESPWGSVPASSTSDYTVTVNGSAVSVTSVTGTSATGFTLNHTGGFGGANGNVVIVTALAGAGITNQSTASSFTETVTTGAGETGELGIKTVPAGGNVVTINGVVGPQISFTITGGNTFSLPGSGGSMGVANATVNESEQGINLIFSTNAANGANISVSDQYSGLYSSTAAYTIAAVNVGPAVTLSTESYGMGVPSVGTGTVSSQYASSYANAQVGNLSGTSQTVWSIPTHFSSAITLNPFFNAYIITSTPPGNYTDTVVYLASATF